MTTTNQHHQHKETPQVNVDQTMPRYPDIVVQLSGQDGNAFAILGRVSREMRRSGVPADQVTQFMHEAQSGDYDNLLVTCDRWVTVY